MEQGAFDFSAPPLDAEENAVLAGIPFGRGNARTSREIAEEIGMSDRYARRAIKHLREEHCHCIGSSSTFPPGYYIIDDPAELEQFAERMTHRGVSILYMVSRIKRASIENIFNQGRLKLEAK
jgi:cytosine/adenosine deaminase-related metal-dependent hydrolase